MQILKKSIFYFLFFGNLPAFNDGKEIELKEGIRGNVKQQNNNKEVESLKKEKIFAKREKIQKTREKWKQSTLKT